jgi:Aberrant zinc-finger
MEAADHEEMQRESAAIEASGRSKDIRVIHRKFTCMVPGCGKKYKNPNGLKYHAQTYHAHLSLDVVRGHSD